MKLTVKDRLVIGDLLPERGSMLDMILARSITEKTRITAKDITELEIKTDARDGKEFMSWNVEKDTGIEIEFEKAEVEMLKKRVGVLDKEEGVTERTFDLCLMIRDLK